MRAGGPVDLLLHVFVPNATPPVRRSLQIVQPASHRPSGRRRLSAAMAVGMAGAAVDVVRVRLHARRQRQTAEAEQQPPRWGHTHPFAIVAPRPRGSAPRVFFR
jgi:hypothetical protein